MRVFSLVSCKDSFRIIMVFMERYDLELHQMDVKTAFTNGIYMKTFKWCNPKGFIMEEKNIWDAACRNPFIGQK